MSVTTSVLSDRKENFIDENRGKQHKLRENYNTGPKKETLTGSPSLVKPAGTIRSG